MGRRILVFAVIFSATAAWAADEPVRGPGWDPNRDPEFAARYIRREMDLELERVDPRRGITGNIRNQGAETLTRVRVLLTFLDKQGRPSGEYEFSALPWAGPVEPGEPAERPLGPGASRRFLVYPSSVPLGWSDRWQAAVESITFTVKKSP